MTTSHPTRTFVSLTGPAGNIGDALIRRGTLDWARGTSDELIAYVGDAPEIWLRQLGLDDATQVLRTKRSVPRWLWMIATSRRRPVLVFEAGEVPLDRGNVLRELVFLAETVLVRLKRGVVVRPPRGIRAATRPALDIHAAAARRSQVALWRDDASARLVAGHSIVPDIGFAAGLRDGRPWHERDEILISLRGAREMPDADWLAAVTDFAAAEGLRIGTIVQVREDADRSRHLADALGGTADAWNDDTVAHEAHLRERYDNARYVISDRMHVLVLAALSGAVPLELVPNPTGKITAAFAAIGLHGVTADAATTSPRAALDAQRDRHDEVRAAVAAADRRLAAIDAEVRARIARARA